MAKRCRLFATASLLMLLLFSGLIVSMKTNAQSTSLVKIDTRLYNAATGNMLDANVVVFDVQYSNAVDGNDAYKFPNQSENLGIRRNNATLIVEGRQPPSGSDTIQYWMWNMQQVTYRLEIEASNMNNMGVAALLEDTYLNTRTPLNFVSGTINLNFTVNSIAASYANNRFRVVFAQAGPLPVKITNINASDYYGHTKINWNAVDELNVKYYDVQGSPDGLNFHSLGSVKALSNAPVIVYEFIDTEVITGDFFYRIKSIDYDGKEKVSVVVKCSRTKPDQTYLSVINVPESGQIKVLIKQPVRGKVGLMLYNNSGQLLVKKEVNVTGSGTSYFLDIPSTVTGICRLVAVLPDQSVQNIGVLVTNY